MKRPWLKQYETHVPHSITYPEIPVHRLLLDTVAKHPDDIAISFNEIQIPYKELNARVNMFAHALRKAGRGEGDTIAFAFGELPRVCHRLLRCPEDRGGCGQPERRGTGRRTDPLLE